MFNTTFTNADITKHDWAPSDRAALLRSLHARPAPRAATATGGWAMDITGNDPRLVRAYLKGKGDLRAIWWSLPAESFLENAVLLMIGTSPPHA